MGTIIPTGIVNLLKGVPLDNKYNETVYVTGTQQTQVANFLASYPYLTFNNHEYQRVNEGVLRLNAQIANVYNVNYMIFRNMGTGATYEDHWFFAFVNKVEYVNERAVNIYYEIDVFQTYCLDWTLEPCMVERTHTTTDVIGENTIAEPIDTGKLICQKREVIGSDNNDDLFRNYSICIWLSESVEEGEEPYGMGFGGVYTGLRVVNHLYNDSGVNATNHFINQKVSEGKGDSIVAVTMLPTFFLEGDPDSSGLLVSPMSRSFTTGRPKTNNNYTLDGYKPKNNKLLTAPYTCFEVDVQTDKGLYFYERFGSVHQSTNTYNFNIKCSPTPNPDMIVMPSSYDGASGYNQVNNSLIMNGFVQCSFATDSYKAWLAQNSGSYYGGLAQNAVGGIAGLGTAIVGVAAGNPVAIISGTASVINSGIGAGESIYNSAYQEMKGDVAHGTTSSATMDGVRQRAIIIRHLSVRADYARMIDDFFTRFGYAVGRIQMPNLAARKAFTYIKTNGMSIRGAIPSDDIAKINSCFDRGITFFRTLANVGNYSVDNTL